MSKAYRRLSIIVPVYNEKKTVLILLEKLIKLKLLAEKEIIVVDDGSSDGTSKLIRQFVKKHFYQIKFLSHQRNRGKGWAIRTALKQATGDVVVIQDADLEYKPEDLVKMFKVMKKDGLEVLYGSRHKNKKKKKHAEFFFYWGGLALNWLTNFLYGTNLTDEATCYKMFRTRLLRSFKLKCERFEFCPEVTAKTARRGIRIEEIPVHYNPRFINQGKKIKLKDGVEAVLTLLRWRLGQF